MKAQVNKFVQAFRRVYILTKLVSCGVKFSYLSILQLC